MLKLLFVLLSVSLISAQQFFNSACPDRPVQQDFDLQKYISQKWYEVYRYNAMFQKDCECSRAIYTLNSDKTVKVHNCCKKPTGNECAIGKAIVSEPDHLPLEAKLNVAFGDQPLTKSNYWVLSTDYEKYSVVYTCGNIPGNKSIQFAWILSTTPQLDESVSAHVNELVDKYFDRSVLITVNQSESFCEPRD
ncbi:apolipoprotein D-like [Chironomus tepperi]|uniref:apolipoprotein D-like n=1 Tax=Chironomus tepperi TaxID=113505 RepID=UPI00391F59D9